jgi:hypothetical protein
MGRCGGSVKPWSGKTTDTNEQRGRPVIHILAALSHSVNPIMSKELLREFPGPSARIYVGGVISSAPVIVSRQGFR